MSRRFDVFLSYRRDEAHSVAQFLRAKLQGKGWRVFLDVSDLGRGRFDELLLEHIENTANFVLVLSKDALAGCDNEHDWVRKEVARAILTQKNIVPISMPDFDFPQTLPPDLEALRYYDRIPYSHTYADSVANRIMQRLSRPLPLWQKAGLVATLLLAVTLGLAVFVARPRMGDAPGRSAGTEKPTLAPPVPTAIVEQRSMPKQKSAQGSAPKISDNQGTILVKVWHNGNLQNAQWYWDDALKTPELSLMNFSYFRVAAGEHRLKIVLPEATCSTEVEVAGPEQELNLRCPM